MNRETKEIKTPIDGHKVEIKTYITGREQEQIDDILYRQLKVSAGTSVNVKELEASFITDQTHKLIEIMIVAVNDKKEKILDTILDMKRDDYKFVLVELNKATAGGSIEERKKKVK